MQCVSDIHNQINTKMSDRNVPSALLQPYLSARPVMTKYSHFPIVDPRKPINVPPIQMPAYNLATTFNPGTATAPWSGFATNINTESELRNQIYAIQKCSQAAYVPSSNSDLYNHSFRTPSVNNPHELLFRENVFNSFNPNPDPSICGTGLFMNSTRCQVKDITRQTC